MKKKQAMASLFQYYTQLYQKKVQRIVAQRSRTLRINNTKQTRMRSVK